jgi:DNA-binding CsgD family transcriptional regulator
MATFAGCKRRRGGAMRSMLCPVLFGREAQVAALREALEMARGGAGRLVLLLGEAGVGKSRLAREITQEAHSHDTVLTGRALPGSGPTALRAFADALQPAFRHRRPPDADALRPFVAALARLIPEWRTEALPEAAEPLIIAEGVLRLLRVLAGPTATVLVLEDLHWADPETLAVLEYLADHIRSEPILCVVTARTDERTAGARAIQSLTDRRAAEVIGLARLNEADTLAMAQACLASPQIPLGLADLVAQAEGIPFLVEELLASAVAAGALTSEAAGWRFELGEQRVLPVTFAESVRRRLSVLGPHVQVILQAGAIFGRAFDWTLVGPTVQLADELVVAGLRSAEERQLVVRAQGSAATSFRFRHALTREAILAELLAHEQAALAARALAVVEAFHSGLPGDWCITAIGLAQRAGLHARAAELLVEVALREVAAGALATAEEILRQARERASSVPLPVQAAIDAAFLEVLAQAGKTDQAVSVAERLLTVLDALDADDRQRATVHLTLARAFAAASRWEDAGAQLVSARRLAAPGASQFLAAVDVLTADIAMGQQQLSEARDRAQAALATAQRADLPDIACHALEILGRAARMHDLAAAERYFAAAVQLAERRRLVVRRLRALHELGTIGMFRGHQLEYLEQANQLALETGALSTAAVVNLNLGAVYIYGLEHEAALDCARRSADIAAHLGLGLTEAAATAMQATAHALAGRRQEMELSIARAFALAPGHPDIAGQVWGNARGLGALLQEERASAMAALNEAVNALRDPRCTVPGGIIWPLWALLRTLSDDGGAAARAEVHASRAVAVPIARAVLGYADAVALGRAAQPTAAMDCFGAADTVLCGYQHQGVRPLGLRLIAEAALNDGWGEPVSWLREALSFFDEHKYHRQIAACRRLLQRAGAPAPRRGRGNSMVPPALRAYGVTSREVDVLRLIMQGLSNTQIGERLYLSPKTVEKHIEHLMDKTGAARRMELTSMGRAAGVDQNSDS